MSKVKRFVLSLFLFSFLFCMLGDSSQAQIKSKGPGPSSGIFTLTPLLPIGPSQGVHLYRVFNATPGGTIYIISGFQEGDSNNIICPELVLDIHPFILEDTLTANRYGHAYAFIRFPRPTPTHHGTFFMQAIDLEECEKSNLTEYDF